MMRLKLSMLFEKTESELGLFPEAGETVSPASPLLSQNSQDVPTSTIAATKTIIDETPEAITPTEPALLTADQMAGTEEQSLAPARELSPIGLTPIREPVTDTAEPAPEHVLRAHQAPGKLSRRGITSLRSSARWVIALTCILIPALMIPLIPKLHGTLTAPSKASAATPSPTSTTVPVPAAYGVRGHLVLDNTLTSAQTGSLWNQSTPTTQQSTGCYFLNNSYDMRDTSPNYCLASNTDYADFVYQIDMKTIQGQSGNTGGIVFRVDDNQDTYYSFQVCVDGSYSLIRNSATDNITIGKGRSAAIIQGDQQSNLLAVKAIGKDLFLYVNFHLVEHVQDLSYTHGNIGIGVVVNSEETEVAFHDAKVWRL
jgi:hypothetical protein